MSYKSVIIALVSVLFASIARAADPPTTVPAPFSLTIYNPPDDQSQNNGYYYNRFGELVGGQTANGFAVVRETRPIDLSAGDNIVRFTDVAAAIDPTTVSFKSLTAPDTTAVLEQNYEYDLVNGDKLLQKYLGKAVTVHVGRGDAAAEATATILQGDLLSFDRTSLVIKTSAAVEVVSRSEAARISLASMDSNLIVKPTLVWKIHADQAGRHQAQVTYQTDSIGWRADYTLSLDQAQTGADIGAWVTIGNESGLTYPDASLKLVAGNVRRVSGRMPTATGGGTTGLGGGGLSRQQFLEQGFFDYHLYTLQRTTTLTDNSTKQIELFPSKTNIPVAKSYVYYSLPSNYRNVSYGYAIADRDLRAEMSKQVDVYIHLDNTQKNGMGLPLPAGHARVYLRDLADNTLEFIGEDTIDHTPKDEKLKLRIGSAFDIVGEHTQTDFSYDEKGKVITESFNVTVKNHKNDPVDVAIMENLYRWSTWEIKANSDTFDKVDSRTIQFPVTVPANGEKTVTYTVRYTW